MTKKNNVSLKFIKIIEHADDYTTGYSMLLLFLENLQGTTQPREHNKHSTITNLILYNNSCYLASHKCEFQLTNSNPRQFSLI